MKRIRKINRKNLPARSPIGAMLLMWLVMERLDWPGWAWGVVYTIFGVALVAFLVELVTVEDVDVLEK